MYTTIEKVRTLTGLENVKNITDENIKAKIITASSMIDSSIGYVYSLPLLYHFSNTLTFSGTASSGGTLSVIINGTTYTITVTSGDTPSVVADSFRNACSDSIDFVTDSFGLGAISTIISKSTNDISTSFEQVNITSASDGCGVTMVIGQRVKRYNPSIDQYTAQIATALLFIDQYGNETTRTGINGKTRMDDVMEVLQKLQGVHKSGQSIKIYDEITSVEIAKGTQTTPSGYPNETSNYDKTDSTSPKIWMNKVF